MRRALLIGVLVVVLVAVVYLSTSAAAEPPPAEGEPKPEPLPITGVPQGEKRATVQLSSSRHAGPVEVYRPPETQLLADILANMDPDRRIQQPKTLPGAQNTHTVKPAFKVSRL